MAPEIPPTIPFKINFKKFLTIFFLYAWWAREESNLRPRHYQ